VLSAATLASFAVAAFLLIIVPGPSVLFVISRGVALGRRAAVLTVVGNAAGAALQVTAVAAGIGAIVERSVVLYDVLRLGGAAYIVYLGVQAVRHRTELSLVLDATAVRPRRQLLREGFVVGVTNPKVIVFFTAVLPQFVEPDRGAVPVQMLLLGAVFVAIALVSDSTWGLLAGTARTWFASRPHRLERLGGAGGLVIIGLGARLALTGRRD
jgi:threonine/homoserine/homoserine lactone efflux protein